MRTATHQAALDALSDPNLAALRFGERYSELGTHLGLDFGAIVTALAGVPLALRDGAHAETRAAIARLLAESRPSALEALPGIIERRFRCLRRPGTVDLLAEAIEPSVDDLLRVLTGIPFEGGAETLLSRIFSQTMGVSKRRRLNREIALLQDDVRGVFPGDPPARHAARLALLLLGRDTMIGTLALSLHDHLVATDGEPVASRRLPVMPTRTGLPFVAREAIGPTRLGGCPVERGDIVRISLDGFRGGDESQRQRYFGHGAHVCLGRPVSLAFFERLSAFLATIGMRASVTDFGLRRDDVFAYPDRFVLEVRP